MKIFIPEAEAGAVRGGAVLPSESIMRTPAGSTRRNDVFLIKAFLIMGCFICESVRRAGVDGSQTEEDGPPEQNYDGKQVIRY